jgi:hypothetical protein
LRGARRRATIPEWRKYRSVSAIVTTIIRLLDNLDRNVQRMRDLMEAELGEEEEDPEDDS